MTELNKTVTRDLLETRNDRVKEFLGEAKPSRFRSWRWVRKDFGEALDWIMGHPHDVRRGIYMSDTPGKEVWRLTVPSRFGGKEYVLKTYLFPKTFWDTFEESEALKEARNYAALEGIGVPAARVMACGETRLLGKVKESFIITGYIADTVDGSALMPGGYLWDKTDIRMAFSQKTLAILAHTHQCGFLHQDFHPRKLLIGNVENPDELTVTLIDVANGLYKARGSANMLSVAKDLFTFFVDMRLSADEIRLLCGYYLEHNPHCGFTPDSLWKMLKSLE